MEPTSGPRYRITLNGVIDSDWSDWLGALSVRAERSPDGIIRTVLTGPISDQAALRGILTVIWDLNLELVALERVDHSL